MAVSLSPFAGSGAQFFNNNGTPLAGGQIYTYLAGTTTPQPTYTTSSGSIAQANPIVLDAAGRVPSGEIWLTNNVSYKFVLQDSLGSLIATYDNISAVGISQILYTPPFPNSVTETLTNKLSQLISVKDFGAAGDGTTNDTTALQNALAATRSQGGNSTILYWNKGTYLITGGLTIGSNQTVIFDPGVVINLVPASNVENTNVFNVSNQTNVTFYGNGATINMTRNGAVIEGGAAAFFLYGADNVFIQSFTINNSATDGITITGDNTGSGPCTNVLIQNCVVTNPRRNGMSIISAIGCTVENCTFTTANGAPAGPWAGIDVEPNSDCFLQGVSLINIKTVNNKAAGIQITPGSLSANGAASNRFELTIIGGTSQGDGTAIANVAALWFDSAGSTNKVYGSVNVYGYTIENPWGRGVDIRNWDASLSPHVLLDSVTVINPDSQADVAVGGVYDRCGFVINADSTQYVTNLGNVTMRNCWAEDTRATPFMQLAFVVAADAGKQVQNVTIIDPYGLNYVGGGPIVRTSAATTSLGLNKFDVIYNRPIPLSSGGSQPLDIYIGQRLNATAAQNLTLPYANNCVLAHYEIMVAPGINSVSIFPQTGDTIEWYGNATSQAIVLDAGANLKIRSVGSNNWIVESISGQTRIYGTNSERQIQWTNVSPASGTWNQGDIAFNVLPAVGSPKGWVCTVGGTPGTWVSMGNL